MLRSASEAQWLRDLGSLLRDAKGRFADVCWEDEGSGRVVYAHKALVYARATGSFQQRYLGVPHSLSEADLSQYGPSTTSLRTFTPSSILRRDSAQSAASDFEPAARLCTPDRARDGITENPVGKPRSLGPTDVGVFETALEYLYTASGDTEAFATVLDGFQDATDDDDKSTGVQRLRQDLLYCWRSKLYSDISIALDDSSSEPFAAHRAVLVSRSPYFSSLLLGEFRDSSTHTVTLPSPPFTAASLTFILGYIYSGTLDFSPRKFDLATTFEIWRGAAFLAMDGLQSDIEDRILDMLTPQRAARILDFGHSPDVSSQRLIAAAAPLVAEHFHEAWCATPHVGNLPYEAQKALVRRVCDAVSPAKLAHVATRLSKARRRLEPERAPWAEHIRSMLDAVEETLVRVLGRDLPGVVASDGFVDLINGVGFSRDVLEWLLSLVVKGLTEASAPRAYQALVGSVLLREEGIFADARVLVDDARAGVLGYIKRKWLNIRDAGGFSGIDGWCLQELADEIDVAVADLKSGTSALQYSPAKASKPPQRLLDGTRRAVPVQPVRAPRRSSTVSTSSYDVPGDTHRVRTASAANSGARDSTIRARPVQSRASVSTARQTDNASSSASNRQASTPAVRPRAPLAARRPAAPSTGPANRSVGTANHSHAESAATPSPRAPLRSSASSTRSLSSPSSTAATTTRRGTSPAPSASSLRSTRSTATARPNGVAAAVPARQPQPADTASPRPPPRPSREGSTSARPPNAASPAARRQPSSTSLRSVRSTVSRSGAPTANPASAASPVTRRGPSTGAGAAPGPVGATGTLSSRTPLRTTAPGATPRSRAPRPPATASAAGGASARPGRPSANLPGTSLLAGIPCIVTVQCERAMRIKARVRYIGRIEGDEGQWVGVEALESAIPAEAQGLAWNDGSKGGVSYFKLSSAGPAGADTSASSAATSRAASPSLRPPSRRVRRSTSSEREASGPRKGLFVRPEQIMYVL